MCELRPTLRFWIWFCLAAASLLPLSFAHADPADDSLRLYAVNIGTNYGIYLGKGLANNAPLTAVLLAPFLLAGCAGQEARTRLAHDLPSVESVEIAHARFPC